MLAARARYRELLLTGREPYGPQYEHASLLTIFVLAVFVGFYVVWSVTPALHSPLMAVTNAVSSVIIVGAILEPQKEIKEGFMSISVVTKDGEEYQGYPVRETGEELALVVKDLID